MLYPPPPSPPREPHQSPHHSTSTHHYDDDVTKLSSSSSDGDGDGDGDGGKQKLTRAQRKRLRKKKLRQAAFQRRPIIGPLLPTSSEADEGLVLDETQPVRHNAAEESVVSGIHSAGELHSENIVFHLGYSVSLRLINKCRNNFFYDMWWFCGLQNSCIWRILSLNSQCI